MSNDIIKGYVILALKNLKFGKPVIDRILDELEYLFDIKTLEEAKKYYEQNRNY